jgi:hypothetical protein
MAELQDRRVVCVADDVCFVGPLFSLATAPLYRRVAFSRLLHRHWSQSAHHGPSDGPGSRRSSPCVANPGSRRVQSPTNISRLARTLLTISRCSALMCVNEWQRAF